MGFLLSLLALAFLSLVLWAGYRRIRGGGPAAGAERRAAYVVLRDTSDASGTRRLSAQLQPAGDLLIQGCDAGRGVEDALGKGTTEYEWAWTIRAGNIPRLAAVLGTEDVLAGLQARFSDERAGELGEVFESEGIPVEFWSRMGD